jgi:hypothetical protein
VWGGGHESRVMAGMLGIHHNALQKIWGEIASRIGLKIISLGKEVMAQNRAIEMTLSPTDEAGKATVFLCGDARWDKRSSGRNYSSISGCALALGCRSQLVWDAEPMSNLCIKCMKVIPHDEEVCPKNVDCTAKAMEAIGICKIVLQLYHSGDCVVLEYVSDDSSTKNVLRHSYADELEKGLIDNLPRYENGKKNNDTGLLPIGHPAIKWLADRNHHIRSVSKKYLP